MGVVITNPLAYDLTPVNLRAIGLDPIVPGDYVTHRYQYRRGGAAVALVGKLVMSVRRKDADDADLVFQRRSMDLIGASWSSSEYQLAADTNQTTEDTDAETGLGWWTMTFAPPDETVLRAAAGTWWYDVKYKPTSGARTRTLLAGRILIPLTRTQASQFTP